MKKKKLEKKIRCETCNHSIKWLDKKYPDRAPHEFRIIQTRKKGKLDKKYRTCTRCILLGKWIKKKKKGGKQDE